MSRLLQILELIYKMQPEEVNALADTLTRSRIESWKVELNSISRKYGCNRATVSDPRREDLNEIRRMSKEDAQSISQTWLRDVRRQLKQLYETNPRGNRHYYAAHMERWARSRAQWKNLQIANYTHQSTISYTADRFRQMNGVRGGNYIYSGPPPVGKECIKRFGWGKVPESTARQNPTPAHPNCPHRWEEVEPIEKIPCDQMWTG